MGIILNGSKPSKIIYNGAESALYFNGSKIWPEVAPKPPETADIGGKLYIVAEMPDGKIWMCENLDYGSSGVYYNNDESTYGWNGMKYGKLYTWDEAVAAANAISGWHLPSADEWDALATAVGGSDTAGTKLKSTTGWDSGNGTDDYGFAAFPAGFHYSGYFVNLGNVTCFWTANVHSTYQAYLRFFNTNASMNSGRDSKDNGFSVRLVKDSEVSRRHK